MTDFCSCGFKDVPDVDHSNLAINSVIIKLETARDKAKDGETNYFDHIDLNNLLHKLYHVKLGLIESRHYKQVMKKMINSASVGARTDHTQQKIEQTVGGEVQNGRE
jgi:hypothetical protein